MDAGLPCSVERLAGTSALLDRWLSLWTGGFLVASLLLASCATGGSKETKPGCVIPIPQPVSSSSTILAADEWAQHRFSAGIIPISRSWIRGGAGDYDKIDDFTFWNLGVACEYGFLPVRYLSVGIRLDLLHPLASKAGYANPNDKDGDEYDVLRMQVVLRALWPLLDDRLEFSVSMSGGGIAESLGDYYSGTGWTTHLHLGFSAWLTPDFGLLMEGGSGFDRSYQAGGNGQDKLDRIVLTELHLGGIWRF